MEECVIMVNLEDYFKYEDSAKKEDVIDPPNGDLWCSRITVTECSERKIIPVAGSWTVAISIGHGSPVFLTDGPRYLKPKDKTLEQGLVVSFLRQEGRVRCGVPFEEIRLADGSGFGFAAYFKLKIRPHNETKFLDAVFSEGEKLTDFELVDDYVRALITNCLARDFKEIDSKTIVSGSLELNSRIRDSVNTTARANNLPTSLGLVVTNVVLESTKIERLDED